LADSSGRVNIDEVTIFLSFPRFEDQSHTEGQGVRTQPGRTCFTNLHQLLCFDF